MPKVEWNESLSVHNPELDEQHKQWIELINTLHEGLMHGSIKDLKVLSATTLKKMRDYTCEHFAKEEEFLERIDYPDRERHKRIHQEFVRKINTMYYDSIEGTVVLNTTIMNTLQNWLKEHIIKEDLLYGNYALRRPESESGKGEAE